MDILSHTHHGLSGAVVSNKTIDTDQTRDELIEESLINNQFCDWNDKVHEVSDEALWRCCRDAENKVDSQSKNSWTGHLHR